VAPRPGLLQTNLTQKEKEQEDQVQDPSAAAEEAEEEDEEDRVEDDGAAADDDAAAERPKLDDGFYEIEAIRRRRLRKVTLLTISLSLEDPLSGSKSYIRKTQMRLENIPPFFFFSFSWRRQDFVKKEAL